MENKIHVFVTGITGNQGGAVARHLIAGGHKVSGLTRDANAEKAQQWKNQGVAIIKGNLNDPTTYASAISNSDAIYLVQPLQGKANEIEQGKQFLDIVKSKGNKHLVYASVLGADLDTGIPHFESKYALEQYIKSSNIAHTILRPASFYENYLHPQVASGIKKGKFVSPLDKSCKQQMIGVDDIGKIAAQVFSNSEKYALKTLSIATDENEVGNAPQLFSKALGKPVAYKKLPGILVRLAMGKDLHKMFKYMNQNNFCVINNVQDVRDEFKITGDLTSWIEQNFTPAPA